MISSAAASALTCVVSTVNSGCSELLRPPVAECDHVTELPRRVDMQQRKRRPRRCERLHRKMEQDRGVLADRIERTGFWKAAATSRRMWMLSASRT